MGLTGFIELPDIYDTESLHLDLKKGIAKGRMNVLRFVDKDSKQYVLYMPSLELTGYGETVAKAKEMLQFAISDYFGYLSSFKNMDKIQVELHKLGWEKGMFNKDYLRAYIDGKGELQSFNAENGIVERLTFQAA